MRSCPKILLFSDDQTDMDRIAALLEDEGCQVRVTNNEMEAVNLLGCWHYDVAVINIEKQLFRQKIGSAIISFCSSINCDYILMSKEPKREYKGINGHAVLDKDDSGDIISRVLGKVSSLIHA